LGRLFLVVGGGQAVGRTSVDRLGSVDSTDIRRGSQTLRIAVHERRKCSNLRSDRRWEDGMREGWSEAGEGREKRKEERRSG
jgi:hypothetical protein